jgi:hypothetical protein
MGACLPTPSKSEDKIDADQAVFDLKRQRDRLSAERTRLFTMYTECRNQAVSLKAAGDTRRALLVLKKSKVVDEQVAQIDNSILQVESLALSLESQASTNAVVTVLAASSETLKATQRLYSPEFVADLMADVAEAREQHLEISNAISAVAGPVVDDAVIDAEYAALLAEISDASVPVLPEVPADKPAPEAAEPNAVAPKVGLLLAS